MLPRRQLLILVCRLFVFAVVINFGIPAAYSQSEIADVHIETPGSAEARGQTHESPPRHDTRASRAGAGACDCHAPFCGSFRLWRFTHKTRSFITHLIPVFI